MLYTTHSDAHTREQIYALARSCLALLACRGPFYLSSDVWTGTDVQSSNGGVEFSTIDPPHVSELHYMANCSYTGNVEAAERWESFTVRVHTALCICSAA